MKIIDVVRFDELYVHNPGDEHPLDVYLLIDTTARELWMQPMDEVTWHALPMHLVAYRIHGVPCARDANQFMRTVADYAGVICDERGDDDFGQSDIMDMGHRAHMALLGRCGQFPNEDSEIIPLDMLTWVADPWGLDVGMATLAASWGVDASWTDADIAEITRRVAVDCRELEVLLTGQEQFARELALYVRRDKDASSR
jgi:hypothetical protein